MTKFTDIDETIEFDGFTISACILPDDDMGAPWAEHDGHGEVTDWTRRDKTPGELVLSSDGDRKRYYDFAGACATARKDGWGPSPYRLDVERGANGLLRVSAKWFEGRDLIALTSIWHDDENAARTDVYDLLKETVGARRYAAMAARADFERMRDWANDQWSWVGVQVSVSRKGTRLGSASLWGIESDSYDYHLEVANELVSEALDAAKAHLAELTR